MPSYSAGLSFTLLFDPEDGGVIFLRNLGLSPNYTVSQTRRFYCKYLRFCINLKQIKHNDIKYEYVFGNHMYQYVKT
jgi:hypothetical protein